MTLSWIAVAARTGRIIEELPGLECSRVPTTIGRYETTTADLPLPTAPEAWERATRPYGSAMVLLDGDAPLWGGLVTSCTPDHTDRLPLTLATAEAYLARRNVGDVTYSGVGQNAIVADLVARFATEGANPGLPIRVDYTGAGTLRDRTYTDASDQTLYDQLQELSAVPGGPEWTIGWEHQSNPERYTPVLRVANRLGSAPAPGMAPATTFDMANVVSFALALDWTAGQGATSVVATGTAQADVRPQSLPQTVTDPDRPQLDYRWNPSDTGDLSVLTGHAARALSSLSKGGRTLAMTVDLGSAPKLGTDWFIGDTVGYDLQAPSLPNGLAGTARATGWWISPTATPQITPTLLLEG